MKKLLSELRWNRRSGSNVELKKKVLALIGQNGQSVVITPAGKVPFIGDQETCQAAKELGWTEIEVFCAVSAFPCG